MLWLLDLPDDVAGRPVAAAAATGNTTINGVHMTQIIQSNNAGVASMQASRAAEFKVEHHRHLMTLRAVRCARRQLATAMRWPPMHYTLQ